VLSSHPLLLVTALCAQGTLSLVNLRTWVLRWFLNWVDLDYCKLIYIVPGGAYGKGKKILLSPKIIYSSRGCHPFYYFK
jgi:hypothetical protein